MDSNLYHRMRTGPLAEPGEAPDSYCRRLFGGQEWLCRRCEVVRLPHPGICDRCMELCEAEDRERSGQPDDPDVAMKAAGVPERCRSYTWAASGLDEQRVVGPLRSWVWDGGGDSPGVLLWGSTGTGKTGAAVCMLRDQLALRKPAQYVYVPDWLDALRDAEREGNPRMVFDAVASFRGLLALDELIADRHTTYGLDRLLQLVDRRSREKLMTVATANLKPMPTRDGADCIHDMSPRLASRLAEWWVYSWSGRDRRMRPNRSGQSGQSA